MQKATTDTTAAPGARTPHVDALQTLLAQARKGDTTVLPALLAHLDAHPEHWRQQGNLARELRETLLWKISGNGTDLLKYETTRRWVDAQAQALAGPAPSALEQLLSSEIVRCLLHVQFLHTLEMLLTEKVLGTETSLKNFTLLLDSAHRRLLTAVKTLVQVRKLGVPVVQVHIGTHQVNTAG